MKITKSKLKIRRKKVEMREYYDKDIDILNFYWGNKTQHSMELDIHVLIDFDKRNNIVGIEIWDFFAALKESHKRYNELFKRADKERKYKRRLKIR